MVTADDGGLRLRQDPADRCGSRPHGPVVGGRQPQSGRHDATLWVERLPVGAQELPQAWRALQSEGAVGSPFLTWEWFSALADTPELSRSCAVLVTRREDEVVGLFPIELVAGPGRLRSVGCAGWRPLAPDHLDVVARPEDREAVARAIVRRLTEAVRWDLADFDGLVPDGALARSLAAILRPPRFLPRPPEAVPVPFVCLDGDDVAEVRENVRRQVKRGVRAAERSGGGSSVVSGPDRLVELLEELMRLHNRRFGDASAVFATPALRRFHALAARRLAEAGMARMYRLVADGVDAGLLYVLLWENRAFYYQSGMVPEAGHGPGRTVLGQAILSTAGEGFREFDLLRGDEPYKGRFATGTRHDVRIRALRPTARTVAWSSGRLLQRLLRVGRRSA